MTVESLLESVSSQRELFDKIDDSRKQKKVLRHRASSTNTFLSNPLHYALTACLGVYFAGNEKTLFGTVVHEAIDYLYTNQSSRLGLAVRTLVLKAIDENQKIQSPLDDKALKKLIRRAVGAFKKYSREIAIHNEVIHSELYLEIEAPTKKTEHQGKIIFSGTFDRLYRENGKFIMGDLKTSSTRINAKGVEKNQQLVEADLQIKQLNEQITAFQKSIKKFTNSEEKLKEYKNNLDAEVLRYGDAIANDKSYKAISNKIERLEKSISLWEGNLQTLTVSELGIASALTQITEIENQTSTIRNQHNDDIRASELQECINKHYLQVCLYALMYEIVHGIRIDKARIELIVSKEAKEGKEAKEDEIQIFEWDLTDDLFEKADFVYSEMIIPTLEAFLDGTPASILFRQNPFSFFGSETNDLIEKFKK